MNTPSKEALDAAENVQDYWGFPRRATIDLATIIDRHFEPLRAEIVQLTIDRDNWKIRAEEMDEYKADCMELRQRAKQAVARVKEVETDLSSLRVSYKQNASQCVQLVRDNAELHRDNAELQKQEAESRRLFYAEQDKRQSAEFRCEELAEALRPFAEFANKWDKNPIRGLDDALYSIHNEASLRLSDCKTARAALAHHAAGEPAKHPDTEIIDRFEEMCGSLEYCDADEVRNHWRAYGYSGSIEGVGRTMRDALRAAIDAARKEVQP